MAGMEGLGRLFDVVPIAAGQYVRMMGSSAVTFVCTGDDTFTLSEAKNSSGGSAQAPGLIIYDYYTNTATNGTSTWTRHNLELTTFVNAITIASGSLVFSVFGDMLDAGFDYIGVTVGSAGLVTAIAHDLTVQRLPSNLVALVS